MALDKVLVSSSGVTRTIPAADTADVGAGIQSDAAASGLSISAAVGNVNVSSPAVLTSSLTQSGGAVSITGNAASSLTTSAGGLTITGAAASTWSTAAGALTVDSAAALNLGNTNATSVAVGHSGVTTTVTGGLTQLTGAFSLTGNAASQLSTSTGGLTITGAAASTWSTAAGALTITSAAAATWGTGAGVLTLNGFAGTNMNVNGTTYLDYGVTTGSNITIGTGITLTTTGTGQINLPQNFLINSVSTAYANPGSGAGFGQVTAAALNVITAGPTSNADAYHTHTFSTGAAATAGATITQGQLLAYQNNAGVGNVYPATADSTTPALQNVVGVALAGASATNPVTVLYAGLATVPVALFNGTAPVAANIGSRVYMDDTTGANAGKWNLVAPSTSGDYSVHTGIVASISGSNIIVFVQIGEGVIQ